MPKSLLHCLLVILSLLPLTGLCADAEPDETLYLDIGGDSEITVNRFGASDQRVLWFPHERGLRESRLFPLAQKLAEQGLEIWLLPLHDDYFIPPGRNSLNKIPVQHITTIIKNSLPEEPDQQLYLFAPGRAAAMVASEVHLLQKEQAEPQPAGLVLMHPDFTANTAKPGQSVEYAAIASQTSLPIYIFQPERSGKRWYLDTLTKTLEQGGSQVFTHLIEDAGDGYLMRPEPDETEAAHAKRFPAQLTEAIKTLNSVTSTGARKHQLSQTELKQPELESFKETLQPYPGDELAPALLLTDMADKPHDLKDYLGKVVLLNFWASWCPPCVEEVPSLGRLQKRFDPQDFVVLSVDIGEEKAEIEAFLEKIPADYPVMLDPEGSTVESWKLRAFPTTFVLDRKGYIRLAYFGGLEWDDPQVVSLLESTFSLSSRSAEVTPDTEAE